MNIPHDIKGYIKLVVESAFIDRCVQVVFQDDEKIFINDGLNWVELTIEIERYQGIIDEINRTNFSDMIMLREGNAEVAIRESFSNSYLRYSNSSSDLIPVRDRDAFSIGEASEIYLMYLLYKIAESGEFFAFFRSIGKWFIRDAESRDFFEFLSVFGCQVKVARAKIEEGKNISCIKREIDSNLYVCSKHLSAMLSRVNRPDQFQPGRQQGSRLDHSLNLRIALLYRSETLPKGR